VPNGRVRSASPRRERLTIIDGTVNREGRNRVNPSVYFKPTAQPDFEETSKNENDPGDRRPPLVALAR